MPAKRKTKINAKTVSEALRRAGGVKTVAAAALGISRTTLDGYIKRWKDVRATYEEANEVNLDMAESMLLRQVKEGDAKQVQYYLNNKGQSRGYGRQQLDITSNGETLTDARRDLQSSSPEELARLYKALMKP